MSLPLSILDLVPVVSGGTAAAAVRNSLALARRADALGYTRHWFAEHHNMPMIGSTTPAMMIALAAEVTTRIRVGAGGVMLPNHSPLQVAENFRMLEALHPGRIDLGLGRAPGTDQLTALALRRSREALTADDFPEQLAELLAFGHDAFPAGHPFHDVKAMPRDARLPPVWLLGSSGFSADLAAELGHGFGFAAHFSPTPPDGPMLAYRRRFQPGALPRPHAILTVSVICADTHEEAERLAAPMQLVWVRLRTGQPTVLPSVEEALSYRYTPQERVVAETYRQMQIIGDVAAVKARVDEMVRRTHADEVMITTVTHDPEPRVHSYELLAKAYGLN
ncbi:MAG: LLM class flavin-dependent oxidoreductase [Myxococcota bacterium]